MNRIEKRRNILITILTFLAVVVIFTTASYLLTRPVIEEELTVEAGSGRPKLSDFLLKDYEEVELISGLDETVDMNRVGDYEVVIRVNKRRHTAILHVTDTVAPKVTVKPAEIYNDEALRAEELIERIDDATKTSVSFVKEPDFTVQGEQEVVLRVTDMGGNSTEAAVKVNVLVDDEAPVIAGVQELHVAAGTSVSYKRDVTVKDNRDPKPKLTIDSSGVDLDKIGEYTVIYRAQDSSGNVTEVSTVLHVEKPGVENATEEIVNKLADEVLAEITKPEMSQYEVAKAIFHWVYNRIKFKDGTPKTNWVQGAYRGLAERRGDCYVYAMTSKCLLTRAGIKNMDIEKIPSKSRHYWNLIDIGEGWHHFDCGNGRVEGVCLFYMTDAELMNFSKKHNNSHNYDRTKYPEIP